MYEHQVPLVKLHLTSLKRTDRQRQIRVIPLYHNFYLEMQSSQEREAGCKVNWEVAAANRHRCALGAKAVLERSVDIVYTTCKWRRYDLPSSRSMCVYLLSSRIER